MFQVASHWWARHRHGEDQVTKTDLEMYSNIEATLRACEAITDSNWARDLQGIAGGDDDAPQTK